MVTASLNDAWLRQRRRKPLPSLTPARTRQVRPEPGSVGDAAVRGYEHDGAVMIGKSKGEDLRAEGADLARQEVDHGNHLAANKLMP